MKDVVKTVEKPVLGKITIHCHSEAGIADAHKLIEEGFKRFGSEGVTVTETTPHYTEQLLPKAKITVHVQNGGDDDILESVVKALSNEIYHQNVRVTLNEGGRKSDIFIPDDGGPFKRCRLTEQITPLSWQFEK
jgi:imidazoleglycerol phosphate dehydratase HisB